MNPEPAGTRNGYWMPTFVADADSGFDRDRLVAAMKAADIDGRVFFWPLSMLPAFAPHAGFPVSRSLYRRAFNLPSYHDLDDEGIARVVDVVAAAFPARGRR